MPRQRCRLTGHTFHQVAIAGEGPDPVIYDRVLRPVEVIGEEALCDSHSDSIAEALTEWSCCRLHAGRVPALRVARCLGAPLTESLDLVQRQIISGQVKHGVQQHRGMTTGQNEAVAIRPVWIPRVMM